MGEGKRPSPATLTRLSRYIGWGGVLLVILVVPAVQRSEADRGVPLLLAALSLLMMVTGAILGRIAKKRAKE